MRARLCAVPVAMNAKKKRNGETDVAQGGAGQRADDGGGADGAEVAAATAEADGQRHLRVRPDAALGGVAQRVGQRVHRLLVFASAVDDAVLEDARQGRRQSRRQWRHRPARLQREIKPSRSTICGKRARKRKISMLPGEKNGNEGEPAMSKDPKKRRLMTVYVGLWFGRRT